MEFYKDNLYDTYYSKNGMWMIEHCNGEYEVKLKNNNGAWITVAIYSSTIHGNDALEECKKYINYICEETNHAG